MKDMLSKKDIHQLMDNEDPSFKIVKPALTPKSSNIWKNFAHVYVNDHKQDYVMCDQCFDLLVYKPSYGTNSLSKHIRICQKTKTKLSDVQTSIGQFYGSSTHKPTIPGRIKEEIKTACVEFSAFDCRPFETINGVGFKNLARKIFNAGRLLPSSQQFKIENLLPHPIIVRNIIHDSILRFFNDFFSLPARSVDILTGSMTNVKNNCFLCAKKCCRIQLS